MLEIIWFFLWGILWSIYFILDGFDLGVGMLMPFISKNETQKRVLLNTFGPFWDGNEVWLVTAGGVTFAAFPATYGVMFSILYSPLMIILFGLILRGISLEFRKFSNGRFFKKILDICFFIGSFIPAFLFGVVFANIFQGIPFDSEGIFHGNLLTFFNPYGIFCGIYFLFLFIFQGGLWLYNRTENELKIRTFIYILKIWNIIAGLTVVFLVLTRMQTSLFDNYFSNPVLLIVPLIIIVCVVMMKIYMINKPGWMIFCFSSLTILFITTFGFIGLFPRLIPSTINPEFSMTIYNSASSPLTLKIMLAVVIIFIPVVIFYQIWNYMLFKDTVTEKKILHEDVY